MVTWDQTWTFTIVYQEPALTKEKARDLMISTYRDKAIGWYDSYSPILDVTSMVKQVYPDVTKATLTIYGSNLSAIRIEGPYNYKPPDRTAREIVSSWERGEEWERQEYPPKSGKWYWVIFPCKLEIKKAFKPTIYAVRIREPQSGKEHIIRSEDIKRGVPVTVSERNVQVTVLVLLSEGSAKGTAQVELLVNGVSKGMRSVYLDSVTYAKEAQWDNVQLQSGSNTFVVRVGH